MKQGSKGRKLMWRRGRRKSKTNSTRKPRLKRQEKKVYKKCMRRSIRRRRIRRQRKTVWPKS